MRNLKAQILNLKSTYKMLNGFTFIELILAVSLILVLGTMGTSLAARFLTQNAVANAQDQLIGDLRKAQINAMAGKQNSNWGVNYASNTITLYKGNTFIGRETAFDEKFSVPGGVWINPSSFDVNFARITGKTNTVSINISGSGETKTVNVNAQGMVTR